MKSLNLIIGVEKSLESSRQELALCQDYNVRDHFNVISKGNRVITPDDLTSFLNKMGVDFPNNSNVKEIIHFFDPKSNGILTLENFTDMVAPIQREYRILLNCRIDQNEEAKMRFHDVKILFLLSFFNNNKFIDLPNSN